MDAKKKILIQYKKIINTLEKHNKHYFINDNPTITDSEFDKIKKHALQLEVKYPYLEKLKKPATKIVGAKPSNQFKKVKHLAPMLSLANAFNQDDIKDFFADLPIAHRGIQYLKLANGHKTGEAYIIFENDEAMTGAVALHKDHMGERYSPPSPFPSTQNRYTNLRIDCFASMPVARASSEGGID